MNQNVIILGSNGMLGVAMSLSFQRAGYKVRNFSRHEFNIATDKFEKFQELAQGAGVVVNCAGVIKPLIANTPYDTTMKVNAWFPQSLAKYCTANSIRCFHITSDCVFSGKKGNYSEDDASDAEDLYGKSKAAGDTTDCMTLRTSIIGEERREPFRCLLEWVRSNAGKEVNGYTNHIWNGVTTTYLSELIITIIENEMYSKGIHHIYSPETVTKAQLLGLIDKVYGLDLKIKPMKTQISCDRSMTSKHRLSSMIAVRPLETQIHEHRAFFKNV